MNKILTFSVSAFVAVAVLSGATLVLNGQTAVAAEDKKTSTTAKPADTEKNSYNYVAQPDDTYSQMARKAVQTYGVVNKVKLSQAQIIAAETNLTIKAGSPSLLKGQKVSISKDDVKEWVKKASDLTKEQQAAWAEYTVGVNFNTDAVGQAS